MSGPAFIETFAAWLARQATTANPNQTFIGVASSEPAPNDTIELLNQLADTQEILRIIAVSRNGEPQLLVRAFSGSDASTQSREWYQQEKTRPHDGEIGKTLHEYDPLARP
jgi:hypothetical protein